MSPIALLGERASTPSRGIAPRAPGCKVILTITPRAPVTQACFAIGLCPPTGRERGTEGLGSRFECALVHIHHWIFWGRFRNGQIPE